MKNIYNTTVYLCPQAFGHYFAGRWEGDGHVHIKDVTTGKPSLHITMGFKQKPSAQTLLNLVDFHAKVRSGSLSVRHDNQSCIVNIYHPRALETLLRLSHDKFRSAKGYEINVVGAWLKRRQVHVPAVSLRPFNLNDGWFAGWTDSDGNFYVRTSAKPRIKVEAVYQTNQKVDTKGKLSFRPFFDDMARALHSRVYVDVKKGVPYLFIKAGREKARLKLITYFHVYGLLTSKHLDFLAWARVHRAMGLKNHKRHFQYMDEQKRGMNSLRKAFSWAHLQSGPFSRGAVWRETFTYGFEFGPGLKTPGYDNNYNGHKVAKFLGI